MAYFSVTDLSRSTVRWVELLVFLHFLEGYCLHDKSLNAASLPSINRAGVEEGKRTDHTIVSRLVQSVVMQSYNPRTEESQAGRLLWIPA